MEFNFDSSEHIAYVSSPAAKAINAPAGIWVGFDNQQAAGWVEGKELETGITRLLTLLVLRQNYFIQ